MPDRSRDARPLRRPPAPIVPAGARFNGLVVLDGPARIDGRVRGRILAASSLWIGETAAIEAEVEAEEVIVAGVLEGRVRAARRVELLPTARVSAQLEAPSLVLAEGSVLEGRCRAGALESPPADRVEAPAPA